MALGDRIRDLRIKRDLTQDQLGEMLGMKRANIANYEAGRNVPPADILSNIADIFKVSVDYLLCRTDDPHQIFTNNSSDLSAEDESLLRKFMYETEEIIRSKGEVHEEKLEYVLRFMEFTFKEDLAKEKKNNKS
jgi:HTH-type transcriptional regulator, competence development regulator